ncbi:MULTISPECIES: AraD1 family protein [Sphingomonas]|uniref:AraD1 family protein n=1 Tax=Sphingomonas TaxID=13687 RepID=UPI0006FC4DA5|nr:MULTISPECIES: AraD1 family protein [Sphingomonas]KQM91593.1 FAH family protein [Sphingomonas sp. Leaf226]MDY0967298.1 AraD1 family protein [Sphingomonas sp. CFBP9021]USR02131.1 GguC family protein [Sphingomonas aerolata]
MSLRLLQHVGVDGTRSVIAATSAGAAFVTGVDSVRALAERAIAEGLDLAATVAACGTGASVDIAAELAAGRVMSPIDHVDPAHVVMTGTGLTHLGSAEGRDKMHRAAADAEKQTDSMRMFLEGVERGKPGPGEHGQQPEWFYKGDGSGLVAPGAALEMPDFAEDGGEEPELAGIYLIGADGTPFRLGLCLANEFSDHVTERHNYLWLAHSKLRQASLGPELLVGTPPEHVEGMSRIHRDGAVLWEKPFLSGEANMSHSIANLEAHHFKYDLFRRPGDIHVHFFGTATLSFAEGVTTRAGDVFEIEAAPFTLPLRNTLTRAAPRSVAVKAL